MPRRLTQASTEIVSLFPKALTALSSGPFTIRACDPSVMALDYDNSPEAAGVTSPPPVCPAEPGRDGTQHSAALNKTYLRQDERQMYAAKAPPFASGRSTSLAR